MNEIMEGQECLFGPDIASGRTYQELSAATAEKTSRPFSRSLSKSQTLTLPTCLCLKRESGQKPDSCTPIWVGGQWPGGCTMHSTTAYRNGERGSVYWLTSTDLQQQRFCLTLNMSERPRRANPSKLSEILETEPDARYKLSEKACQGILNRAERRGKELPPELKEALENQSHSRNEPVNLGGAKESSFSVSASAPSQPSTTKAYSIQGNTIDRDAKQNGSGISENVAHTLDSADRHGVMAAGFSFGQSKKARSIGYEEEKSQTIRGGDGGNQKPVTLIASGFDGTMGSKAGNIGFEEERAITTKSCGGGHCLIRR